MGTITGSMIVVLLHLSCYCLKFGTALDRITSTKSIKDPEAITSSNGTFRLGFFSFANSTNRYVGIWYTLGSPENSVIWIANKDKPLRDDSGVVMISKDNNLVVLNGQKEILWSSNVKNSVANVSARVLDSGNLALQDKSENGVNLWESFHQPSNAFVPTMKVSSNTRTGEKVQLTSWKSSSDPSNGSFSLGIRALYIAEIFIWNNTRPYWRSGPWNGQIFIGVRLRSDYFFFNTGINFVNEEEGNFYVTFEPANKSSSTYYLLDSQGRLTRQKWDKGKGNWGVLWSAQETECDIYGKCGEFGSCDPEKPSICSCLRGFEPNNIVEWNRGNWSSGCVRVKLLQCDRINSGNESGKKDGFLKLEKTKVPDFAERTLALGADNCKDQCLNNCSCIAYAYDPGTGCMSWSQNLVDIQKFNNGGIDLYIRLAHSELDEKKNTTMIIIITVVIGIIIIISISIFFLLRWKAKDKEKSQEKMPFHKWGVCAKSEGILEDKKEELKLHQLPLFKYAVLATATTNFKLSNKLGEGGFGPVYKGKMMDGMEIAVKRLSRASGQGFDELANEVLVISKLQHRNLVRLLGCCIEKEEKMLVYEYMPNKSLDAFLFDPAKQKLLDWKIRFNIIEGISRGLLYLHRDSRLRIIHRDLKASNILLDEEMNPKISDFGMARIFGGSENEASTRRVVGTYGYMAPEYVMQGQFSEKSDVFSYGVLLLEIISGRRNTSSLSLLGYVWKLWTEDNILSLTDEAVLSEQSYHEEIKRCIHVGLLCIQEFANDRPTISAVLSMLNSEIVDLPTPKQPAFTGRLIVVDSESSQSNQNRYSVNDVTVTNIEAR